MRISEIIKQTREELGMTQEDLAERLEVSRQAVSKWELGASLPSLENLELLEEVLGVSFPPPEEAPEEETAQAAPPPPASKEPFWTWKRIVLLVLGVLIVSALFSAALFIALRAETNMDVPQHAEPSVTGVYFFNEDAGSLRPDLGDGWFSFTAGERVLIVVEFENGAENSVNAVSLFLTPSGTETFDLREQIAVQAAADGRDFALFAWDIPLDLMGHLEVVLECGGGLRVTETLNVTAPLVPAPAETPGILAIRPEEINTVAGDIGQYVSEVYGVPWEEVEWSSSDPSVARVANTGRIFIEGPGEAVITASWKDQTAECRVRVEAVGEEGNTDLAEPHFEGWPEEDPAIPPQYEPRAAE